MCPPHIPHWCPSKYVYLHEEWTTERITRQAFFETPWMDYRASQRSPEDFTYDSVFALRKHKLQLMKHLVTLFPHRVHIAKLHEVVESGPQRFVEQLS